MNSWTSADGRAAELGAAETASDSVVYGSVTATSRRAGIGAVICLALLAVVGCGGSGHSVTQGGAKLKEASVIGRSCSAAVTKRIVRGVVHAFNSGDTRMLKGVVAPAPKFQWFSAPGPQARFGPAAYRRSTLFEYVQRRHQRHERIVIISVGTSDQADGNFGLVLVRQARDYALRIVDAKGKIDCASTPYLVAWSVGSHRADR